MRSIVLKTEGKINLESFFFYLKIEKDIISTAKDMRKTEIIQENSKSVHSVYLI